MIDDGWIGKPLCGTAIVMGRGPEKWGQAPFFYDYGAGPMLDLGPYYMTALVNMLGPAKSVTAVTTKGFDYRTFGAEVAEQYQAQYKPYDKYPVNVTTHLTGVVEFVSGAVITVIASFDVYKHGHAPIEIYGTEGSLQVPDPNTFGGPVRLFRPGYEDWKDVPLRSATPKTAAASAPPTWPTPSRAAGRTAPAAHSPTMCWRSCSPSTNRASSAPRWN